MRGCLSRAPYWGPGLQPRHVLGIEPSDPLVHRLVFSPLSHTSQSANLYVDGSHSIEGMVVDSAERGNYLIGLK